MAVSTNIVTGVAIGVATVFSFFGIENTFKAEPVDLGHIEDITLPIGAVTFTVDNEHGERVRATAQVQ